ASDGGGHLTRKEEGREEKQAFGPIAIGQFSKWAFVAGGADTIRLQTVDSHGAASSVASAIITAAASSNNPPTTPIGHDQNVATGTSVALSTLFTGLSDPDTGDSVTQFWVIDASAGGGHLT